MPGKAFRWKKRVLWEKRYGLEPEARATRFTLKRKLEHLEIAMKSGVVRTWAEMGEKEREMMRRLYEKPGLTKVNGKG
jgi:hypothetical protein